MRMKKLITWIVTFSMIFSTGIATVLGATASGTTLELQKYSGDVSITNTLGVEMSVSGVSKLFSGYTITTGEGYAWISIDADQVVKLDWNTEVTLKKNGTKTEILVNSGEILFMVNQPLTSTSSFTIRTSTMSTGVRGTIGHVEVGKTEDTVNGGKKAVTKLSMLEGSTLMSTISENDVTDDGQTSLTTQLVSAAQEATTTASSQIGGTVEIAVSEISVGETIKDNGFVAVEFVENEIFQERMEDLTEEEKETIIENAEDSQAEDEQAYQDAANDANDEVDAMTDDLTSDDDTTSDSSIDEEDSSSSSSGGGGGGGSSSGGTTTPVSTDCVVTYYYNNDTENVVYATQTVLADEKITKPALQPTKDGSWYLSATETSAFDGFDSVIYDKTTMTLIWVPIT